MGFVGRAGAFIKAARYCSLLTVVSLTCFPQPPSNGSTAEAFYRSGRWTDAIALARNSSSPSADEIYYAALSLAKLRRFTEAAQELQLGEKAFHRDQRFPTELAGLAYRDKEYSTAKRDLHRALKLDPKDAYANDFLATLYLLDENLPASLKYWNRIGKPLLETIQFNPVPLLNRALRERAFTLSGGQIFTRQRLAETEANIARLGVFYQIRFDLLPRPQSDRFDLVVHTTPYAEPLAGWIGRVLPSLRDLPYEGLDLDFYNIGKRALDFTSFGRWDPNKERVSVGLSGPYNENPRLRFSLLGDAREEIWDLPPEISRGSSAGVEGLSLRRAEAGGAFTLALSPNLEWTVGGDVAYRDFRNVPPNPFFANGWTVVVNNKLAKTLFEWPDYRVTAAGWTSLDAGRVFSDYSSRLFTTRSGLQAAWLPEAKGDRYRVTEQMQGGRTFGNAPLDDLFMLGMERDTESDLWFRGLVGTTDGRKGNAIMGREYGISQTDLKREIFQIPFLRLDAGPFVDAAWTGDPSHQFGSRGMMTATGGEAILRTVSGIKLRIVYGRNLKGGSAFYTSITR